jgi:hypothetical protein
VIAQPDERYEAYCRSSDFIREHIFPGGHLPRWGSLPAARRRSGAPLQPFCSKAALSSSTLLTRSRLTRRSPSPPLSAPPRAAWAP